MRFERIVLLAGSWDTTPITYHFLDEHLGVQKVIVEEGVPRKDFLRKRAKKLGWFTVAGQVFFQILIAKPLRALSRKRIAGIISDYSLQTGPIPGNRVIHVRSVNSDECLQTLMQQKPDLVIVHGTRIISKKILSGVGCLFINVHAGITPRYRGSHGAYWALANNDQKNCGVTVHLVDPGIDTGTALAQALIHPASDDNFVTYPYLQLAEGLKLLRGVIKAIENGEKPIVTSSLNSALWHHPTFWGYLGTRIIKGVK